MTAAENRVPVEFTFDIYKLTKGEQNRGVGVTFRFVTHQCPQQPPRADQTGEWQWADSVKTKEQEYKNEVKAFQDSGINPEGATPANKQAWDAVNKLAEKFGFFEVRNKEVFDYAVMGIEVPSGLFRNAQQGDPGTIEDKKDGKKRPAPRLSIYVKCESPGQLLGMAEPDLYLLEYEQPFALNYVKGMIGVWCWLCIVIGLAVACSTYLSGVLSMLATAVDLPRRVLPRAHQRCGHEPQRRRRAVREHVAPAQGGATDHASQRVGRHEGSGPLRPIWRPGSSGEFRT